MKVFSDNNMILKHHHRRSSAYSTSQSQVTYIGVYVTSLYMYIGSLHEDFQDCHVHATLGCLSVPILNDARGFNCFYF